MNTDAIPQALKALPQWVTWAYEGERKVPYNPRTGKRASSTNAQTWTDFDTACRAAESRNHAGIGFVFTPDDPYTGIDLDDCVEDETIATWAQDIVTTMDSYSEISPSGTGIKIWVEGKLSNNVKTQNIELYSFGRYFTVTGQHLPSTPTSIRYVNGALEQLADSVRPPVEEVEQHRSPSARVTDSAYLRQWADGVIDSALARLRAAPLGTKHNTLLDMSRLLGGLIPLGLANESDLITLLKQSTDAHSEHPQTAYTTIRDGLALGMQKPLTPPAAPPQPLFDADGFACCPHHETRLPKAKNGNGYKCHQKDDGTASTWCDFWWSGAGYVPPRDVPPESVLIAGELVTQDPQSVPVQVGRYQLYKLSGLRALPPIEWLIDQEIPAGLTTIICGASGAGKSFLALDYAIRIALRFPDRLVVYIAPEGGSGYRARFDAWLHHFGGDAPENLVFILQAIPFLDPQAVNDLIATIRPFRPIAVFVDTLARCLVGGDENSAKDIGVFFYHTDMIRQQTSAAVSIVHHYGKSGQFRGSSALYGSVESWIDVTNDDGLITVACGKSKDSKPFAPRYLRMVESGESVVLLPADQVSHRSGELTEAQRKVLETLALDIFTGPGAKRSELVSATGIPEATMYKVLSRLKRNGFVSQSKRGDPYFITAEGLSAIRSYHRELKHQREKLSNYPETINELPDSAALPTINYHQLSPLKGGDSSDSLVESPVADSDSEDLFPNDPTPTEIPIGIQVSPAAPALDARRERQPDWAYLNKMFDAKNWVGFQTHCQLSGITADTAVAQIEAERGIQDDESEVF